MLNTGSHAQHPVTGRVSEPFSGVAFTVPGGWTAWKSGTGYLMGSDQHKGLILIVLHQYNSVGELMQAASEPIQDANGTLLQPESAPVAYGENGISAHYTGYVEWQPAKAYGIGLISPHSGGITILTAVEPASFSEQYVKRVQEIAAGTTFTKPEVPPVVEQWKQDLRGFRLTYMQSYSSGLSGGYSDHIEIHLCPGHTFGYSDKSSVTVNVDGGSAFSHGRGGGAGNWDVVSSNGQPVLQLRFHDGNVRSHLISMRGNDLYLDNRHYFRTRDAICP